VVHKNILFTVRDVELPIFRLQRLRAGSQPGAVTDCKDILLGLYDLEMEYSADALEDAYADLDLLSRRVLTRQHLSDAEAKKILLEIPHCEDVNSRIRRNVLDTQRALSFLQRGKFLSAEQREDCEKISRDIESIDNHTSFIFGKINFLMDTTAGFVNVNQNERVNRLTYASVALMVVSLLLGLGA
ncbi:MAG: magnesium transporter CorA, partial [Burkholderiaceae bacterium]|nr:magnesium transporter CorA [Burkholderiaceae bacterium]